MYNQLTKEQKRIAKFLEQLLFHQLKDLREGRVKMEQLKEINEVLFKAIEKYPNAK